MPENDKCNDGLTTDKLQTNHTKHTALFNDFSPLATLPSSPAFPPWRHPAISAKMRHRHCETRARKPIIFRKRRDVISTYMPISMQIIPTEG